MATDIQTYTASGSGYAQLSNENATYYNKRMLDALMNSVHFMPYGEKVNIPKNSGAVVSMRRLEMPAVTKTAITEGTTPDSTNLTVNIVTGTVQQFGTWVKLSDYLDLVGLDPLLSKLSAFLGEHAGLTQDAIVIDILAAATNKLFGGDASSRATLQAGDVITYALIQAMKQEMTTNNVKEIDLPSGGKGYIAFVTPATATKIKNLTEWKDQNTYVDVENRKKGIIGELDGIYFIVANTAPTFANGGSGSNLAGQNTIVIGKGAFAVADVDGSVKPEIVITSAADKTDPLGLLKTVGWKSVFTAFILNQDAMISVETLNI